jgi:hypothetical protein
MQTSDIAEVISTTAAALRRIKDDLSADRDDSVLDRAMPALHMITRGLDRLSNRGPGTNSVLNAIDVVRRKMAAYSPRERLAYETELRLTLTLMVEEVLHVLELLERIVTKTKGA